MLSQHFTIEEAQLFRQLCAIFGKDRVIPYMSVRAVISDSYDDAGLPDSIGLLEIHANSKCLFTIVDGDDRPCLVVEFSATEGDVVDIAQLERFRHVQPILNAHRVHFITLSLAEFNETLDPQSGIKLVALLQGKLDDADADCNGMDTGE